MHRHGLYLRFCKPTGKERFRVQRFLCPRCGYTVSVLPGTRLTYRPLEVERLQGFFDTQAEVRCGLDPPPGLIEAGCLDRAWNRFLTRVNVLQDTFGQMLPAGPIHRLTDPRTRFINCRTDVVLRAIPWDEEPTVTGIASG